MMVDEECESLGGNRTRLCRGEISISEFHFLETGLQPIENDPPEWLPTEELAESTECVHRGEETGVELSGLPCNCDKRIFACEIAGPAGCTKSREIIGGMLPSGRTIRRAMIGIGDPEIPRQCRRCADRDASR